MSDPEFQRYPMMMTHPAHRPATVEGDGSGRSAGTPVRFPPVFVYNEDQEGQHAAQGYTPNGVSDIAAFNRLTQTKATPAQEPQEFQEWPKWIDGKEYRDEAHWCSATGQLPAEPVVVQAELSDEEVLVVKGAFEENFAELQAQLAQAKAEIEALKNPPRKPHSGPNRNRPRKAA